MSSEKNIIFALFGATGQQGSALWHALKTRLSSDLKQRVTFRVLTRNSQSARVEKMKNEAQSNKIRLEIREVSAHCADLSNAFSDCFGVFFVTTPYGTGNSCETEIQDGMNIIDSAIKANVDFLCFSSVASAEADVPHFHSKLLIENHLKQKASESKFRVGYSIIRPVAFFDNWLSPEFGIKNGVHRSFLKPTVNVQLISAFDIGQFLCSAILEALNYNDKNNEDPLSFISSSFLFLGRTVSIASQSIDSNDLATEFSRAIELEVSYAEITNPMLLFVIRQLSPNGDDLFKMFKWLNQTGYSVDIAEAKRIAKAANQPELQNARTFAEAHADKLIASSQPKKGLTTTQKVAIVGISATVAIGSVLWFRNYQRKKKKSNK